MSRQSGREKGGELVCQSHTQCRSASCVQGRETAGAVQNTIDTGAGNQRERGPNKSKLASLPQTASGRLGPLPQPSTGGTKAPCPR